MVTGLVLSIIAGLFVTHAIADTARPVALASQDQAEQAFAELVVRSEKAAGAAEETSGVAVRGQEVVNQAVNGIRDIATTFDASARLVDALGQSSDQIGAIVAVIKDIADQTNLLALNAAIEAALPAGLVGRGVRARGKHHGGESRRRRDGDRGRRGSLIASIGRRGAMLGPDNRSRPRRRPAGALQGDEFHNAPEQGAGDGRCRKRICPAKCHIHGSSFTSEIVEQPQRYQAIFEEPVDCLLQIEQIQRECHRCWCHRHGPSVFRGKRDQPSNARLRIRCRFATIARARRNAPVTWPASGRSILGAAPFSIECRVHARTG